MIHQIKYLGVNEGIWLVEIKNHFWTMEYFPGTVNSQLHELKHLVTGLYDLPGFYSIMC
jgi:hypothetical protein